MVPRRLLLASLLARTWGLVRAQWWLNIAMTLILAIAEYLVTFSGATLGKALIVLVVGALLVFLVNVGVATRRNVDWEPDIRLIPGAILFTLIRKDQLKTPILVMGKCVVRDPNGAETVSSALAIHNRFEAEYPTHFPGAPPIVPGRYKATWLMAGKKEDRPRVLLTKRYDLPDQAASA